MLKTLDAYQGGEMPLTGESRLEYRGESSKANATITSSIEIEPTFLM